MGEPFRPVTIKDVARYAGVSTATVSHVLNKTRFVSGELAERVNSAVTELGYYPNLLVGSLRKKKSYTVGLVLPSISNETFGQLAETIQQILFKSGYHLIICNTSNDPDLETETLNTLLMKKADSIIAIPTTLTGEKYREIHSMGIPVVLVDRYIPDLNVDMVRVDNFSGTYAAVEHLINLGHKHIGYIDRKVDQTHSLDQRAGYQKALEDHGISFDPACVIRADGFGYQRGAEAARTLIDRNSQLTALFAYFDIMAVGAMRGILDLGSRVPEDYSIVGYDDMPFTSATIPRLTTVSFPVHEIAETVCALVMKKLEREDSLEENCEDRIIVPKLVVRDSTAAPRA